MEKMKWKFLKRNKIKVKPEALRKILINYLANLKQQYPFVEYEMISLNTSGKNKNHWQIKVKTTFDLPDDFVRCYIGLKNTGLTFTFNFNMFKNDETDIHRSLTNVFTEATHQLNLLTVKYNFYNRPRTGIA